MFAPAGLSLRFAKLAFQAPFNAFLAFPVLFRIFPYVNKDLSILTENAFNLRLVSLIFKKKKNKSKEFNF